METVGGRLERDETPEQCIAREVREELRCEVSDLKTFRVCVLTSSGKRHVLIVFTGRLSGTIQFDKREITEVRWVGNDEYQGHEFASNCMQKLNDYFRPGGGG